MVIEDVAATAEEAETTAPVGTEPGSPLGTAGSLGEAHPIADRGWQQPATGVLLTAGMASFVVLWVAGHHLGWLIAGILILDVAVRGTHLLNASVVYRLTEHARSRLASTCMTVYTLGGILGVVVGAAGYRESGWAAVSATGAIAMTIGLGIWAYQLRRAPRPVPRARCSCHG
ncbi:hypothetical protein KO481_24100 [Nocardia sp. NEAU-G5]|uniref:MFS transporter n=1 Tax=Nocardia albiluteola TaxID=2842303 RepID=A0ABS6B5B2_9NOCA|nr:hypothetical protein [Nocardia albiluteola]MBU3064601.1 hypothetical protein [Nocardia albiluteola]